MPAITVKNIPPDLYEQLRASAGVNHRSLNREIIVCIERAVSSHKIDPEEFPARLEKSREKVRGRPITDAQFTKAKIAGRPMIVVDTNIIGYLFLPNERSEMAQHALRTDPQWAAPRLWRSELRNALLLYLRKQRMMLADARRIMDESLRLMAGQEHEVDSFDVLRLAAESGCSAYDCEFVALAQDLNVPLVTVDKQLLKQFPDVAIALDKYVAK